jgi:hypothetical protein
MKTEYQAILAEEIDRIRESEVLEPVDLLVLVPSEESIYAAPARSALEVLRIESGVHYMDYTKDGLRRVSPASDQVRLCGLHSARGLEGSVVWRSALQRVDQIAPKQGLPDVAAESIRNLGCVVLSRAILGSTIVVRRELSAFASIHLPTKILARQAG